jgi:hypothetical protein
MKRILFVAAMTMSLGCQLSLRVESTRQSPTASRQTIQSVKPEFQPQVEFPDELPTRQFEVVGDVPPQVEFPDELPTWQFEVVGDVPGSYLSTWQDTGLVVRQGETIFIKAEGKVSYIGNNYEGPDGWRNLNGREGFIPTPLIPGVSYIALVGRVGDSYLDDGWDRSGSGLFGPGFVGTECVSGPGRALNPPGSGNLFLGVNDSLDDDNSGSFRTRIWIVGRDGEVLSNKEAKARVR